MTTTAKLKTEENITCSIYSSFEDILSLREEWDLFVESVGGDIYFTFDWCRVWWEYYGRKRYLRLYLFYQDEKLIGIMPLFWERIWIGPVWLKMAKIAGSDFTTNFSNPPVKVDKAGYILDYVIRHLITEEGCDAAWLGLIAENYGLLQHLRDAIQSNPDVLLIRDHVRSPYTTFYLPKTFQEYIDSLDKQQRGNFRRGINLIERTFKITQDVIQDESRAGPEFEKFIQMHSDQWKAEGKLGHFHDWPSGVQFQTRMVQEQAKRGRLRLIRLLADEKVISYQLCYSFGNRWYWRLPARLVGSDWDKYSLGRIGLIKEFEQAIDEGVQEVEAGAGHYDYKVRLGGKEYPLYVIMLIKNGLFCRLRASLFSKLSDFLHFCYYRIWFGRLAPRLPFKRRPLWKLWIRTRL